MIIGEKMRVSACKHLLFRPSSFLRTLFKIRSQLAVFAVVFALFLSPSMLLAEIRLRPNNIEKGKLALSLIDGKSSDVYVIDFAKDTITPLVPSPVVDEYPSFSPDGKKITFYSDRSGDREIWVVNTDGTNLTQLTNRPGPDEDASWSPDGTKIVFQRGNKGEERENLYTMNADGSDVQKLTRSRDKNAVPRWSPDGKYIAFTTTAHWPGWDVDLFELATKKRIRTTSGLKTSCRPGWNPTGDKFAFSAGNMDSMEIYIHDMKTGEQTQLTDLPGRDYDAVWHDDGKRVFFVAEKNKGKGDWELFVTDIETKKPVRLTDTNKGGIRYLSWSKE